MKIFILNVFLLFFTLFQSFAIEVERYAEMSEPEKLKFLTNGELKEINSPSVVFQVLKLGLADENDDIRSIAAKITSVSFISLQRMNGSGSNVLIDRNVLKSIQENLFVTLHDQNEDVRLASVQALSYSDAPNNTIYNHLVSRFLLETSNQVKSEILKSLSYSGYSSSDFGQLLIDNLNSESRNIMEAAARGIALVKPHGALPLLEGKISYQNRKGLRSILLAVQAYGEEASYLIPKIEELLSNPRIGGTLVKDLKQAKDNIIDPQKRVSSQKLISQSLVSKAETVVEESQRTIEDRKEQPASIVKSEPTKPTPKVTPEPEQPEEAEPESNNTTLYLLIAAIVIIGAFLLMRRKPNN